MKHEAKIILGPTFCAEHLSSCDEPPSFIWVGIWWQTDDGVEWGNNVMTALNGDGTLDSATLEAVKLELWKQYDEWKKTGKISHDQTISLAL
jgi:hypothetical protein